MRYLAMIVFISAVLCQAQMLMPCGGMSGETDGGGLDLQHQQIFNQLQQMSGWGSCDDSGCSGGLGNGTCWIERYQKYPSITGASAEIYANYAALNSHHILQGDDALFYKKVAPEPANWNGGWNNVTSLTTYYYMKVDSNAQNNFQALEFDMFHFYFINNGGGQTCDHPNGLNQCWRYMMGTQCDNANHNGGNTPHWDLWDSLNGTWNNGLTNIDCSGLKDGNWHKIVLYATIDHTHMTYTFVSLTVDGVPHTNFGLPSTMFSAKHTGDHPNLGAQFQIDVNTSGNGYHEWFDDVRLCTLGQPGSGCPSE